MKSRFGSIWRQALQHKFMPEPKQDLYKDSWGEKLEQGELTPHQAERLEKFVKFIKLPSEQDIIDTIVVLTSPANPPWTRDFELRIKGAAEFANKYSQAKIIVSGLRPDIAKAIPEQLNDNYNEAQINIDAIAKEGIELERFIRESTTTNTRDSVQEVFKILKSRVSKKVLIVCSGYMGKRVDFYVRKYIKDHKITDFDYFIDDEDVREDLSGKELTIEQKKRKFHRKAYEWKRLPTYRIKGDL